MTDDPTIADAMSTPIDIKAEPPEDDDDREADAATDPEDAVA